MLQKSMGTTLRCTADNAETVIGTLRSISEIRLDSEMLDTTTLDSEDGFRTCAQGVRDAGEITVEGYLDSASAGQPLLRTLYLSGAAADFSVCFPDGQKALFTAFVKTVWLGGAQVDEPTGFGAVLRVSGGVTVQ